MLTREEITEAAAIMAALDIRVAQASERAQYVRLYDFVRGAWDTIESMAFVPNWHIDVMCAQLEAVTRGENRRLLINIPPGTAKSLIVSVFWPAWVWATEPSKRFLSASYEQELATEHAGKMRLLVESEWYQQSWPVNFRADQNQKTRFENTDGGWRMATSTGGRATGQHPDFIIIDDPHNVKKSESDVERESANRWYSQTITTRGASRDAAHVVVMQRLHELDLTGHILAGESAEEWVHICLPMRAESPRALVPTKATRPLVDTRTPGELLWPGLFPERKVASLERQMGSYATAGQFQQRPAPAEGGILKLKWLRYYAPDAPPRVDAVVISVDPALKDKQQHDFWSVQAWGTRGPDRFALRRYHERCDLAEAMLQIEAMHGWAIKAYPNAAVTVLIENAAAGPDAIRALRRRITGVVPWQAKGDKVQRAMSAQPVLEAGNVFVPGVEDAAGGKPDPSFTPGWVQQMLSEWAAFPNGAHDDDVDAFTQMILRTQQSARVGMAHIEALI